MAEGRVRHPRAGPLFPGDPARTALASAPRVSTGPGGSDPRAPRLIGSGLRLIESVLQRAEPVTAGGGRVGRPRRGCDRAGGPGWIHARGRRRQTLLRHTIRSCRLMAETGKENAADPGARNRSAEERSPHPPPLAAFPRCAIRGDRPAPRSRPAIARGEPSSGADPLPTARDGAREGNAAAPNIIAELCDEEHDPACDSDGFPAAAYRGPITALHFRSDGPNCASDRGTLRDDGRPGGGRRRSVARRR